MFSNDSKTEPGDQLQQALNLGSEVVDRYGLSSLRSLLASCRSALAQRDITVAIVGRFKAGKSSFINDFIGRSILPVGVVPVTTVVTEIRFGLTEKAEVHFLDGQRKELPLDEIVFYVSERENQENRKRVAAIKVELPSLAEFRGLTFVDTPGLESVLTHDTDASMRWLPNVGLALVAVSVDPPLSQRDIELLRNVYQYTPNVSVLLTKVDLLAPTERSEVLEFVRTQLAKSFTQPPDVLPYSIRPGFEDLKAEFKRNLIGRTLAEFGAQHRAIFVRKIDTLLRECAEYVTLNLKAAELLDSERGALTEQVLGEKQVVADIKSELRLIVGHAADGTRTALATRLETQQREIEGRLLADFNSQFPSWTKSLAVLLSSFQECMDRSLSRELSQVSLAERSKLVEPLHRTSQQVFRYLQEFRDRLSERTSKAFGVPLRTTEVEIEIQEPRMPDVSVGRVFDRSWELLSPVLPVALIKSLVRSHFARQIPYLVYKNISRLTSQWEKSVNAALLNMGKEAERSLGELLATVERLIEGANRGLVPAIRQDLDRIACARAAIEHLDGTIPLPK
jgi:GTP-binding protein EngB required for normal cell division